MGRRGTDDCGLSRFGFYACALAGFVAAAAIALLGVTTFVLFLGVPELLASFAVVFGFFSLWAGTWLATDTIWDRWIERYIQ
jgi:hypothetical protein